MPIPAHQFFIDRQQDNADLQSGGQRDQGDRLAGSDVAGFQFFDQGYRVGCRGGVPVPVDSDDGGVAIAACWIARESVYIRAPGSCPLG